MWGPRFLWGSPLWGGTGPYGAAPTLNNPLKSCFCPKRGIFPKKHVFFPQNADFPIPLKFRGPLNVWDPLNPGLPPKFPPISQRSHPEVRGCTATQKGGGQNFLGGGSPSGGRPQICRFSPQNLQMGRAEAVINPEIPNCWECPKCKREGRSAKVGGGPKIWGKTPKNWGGEALNIFFWGGTKFWGKFRGIWGRF